MEKKEKNTTWLYPSAILYIFLPHIIFSANVTWLNVYSTIQRGLIFFMGIMLLFVLYAKSKKTNNRFIKKVDIRFLIIIAYVIYFLSIFVYFMLTELIHN